MSNNQNPHDDEMKGFEPMGTKIDPAMAVVWNAVCQALGTDTYHMLQHFIYAMIRMASDAHSKTPEVEKLMMILDSDVAWQNAINLCAPKGKLSISQMILIIEDEERDGFAMTMLNKPFMGECVQIDNANAIIERVIEVGIKGLYKKMRQMKAEMRCEWLSDLLLTMLDAQELLNVTEADRMEMAGNAMFSDYGKPIEYGKKNKRKPHRTPDSLANSQQTIRFNDDDKKTADIESGVSDLGTQLDEEIGSRPFGYES